MKGDFVGRNLAAEFVDEWDRWLQEGMAAGRQQMQESWLSRYLNSPIWHFSIGPACYGSAVAGVMIANVDQVGRYFPLIVAAILPGDTDYARLAVAGSDWFDQLEAAALSTLAESASFESFSETVGALPPAPAFLVRANKTLPFGAAKRPCRDAVALLLTSSIRTDVSLWWTEGTSEIPGALLANSGKPNADLFVALIDGEWERRGWNEP
jgi:type VI secretion system protein ImpM